MTTTVISHTRKVPTQTRPPKAIKYATERKELLDKLINILGISKTNNIFYIQDIDDDKKNQILALADDAKQYFRSSTWTYFTDTPEFPWVSLTRSILHNMDIKTKTISIRDKTRKVIKNGLSVTL